MTTSGYARAGEARALSRRCAAHATRRRCCFLWPVLAVRRAGCSRRRVVSCPGTRWRAAKPSTWSVLAPVPTRGRWPCTPRVARHVGTSGKRAASWLSKTHAPTWAFFYRRQLFPRPALLLGVAPQIAIRRPIRAQGLTLTEHPPGGALALDARGPLPGRCQVVIGPVGAVASTALGAVFPPLLERRRHRGGHPAWLAWGPGDL
jgi:hypothetical protein